MRDTVPNSGQDLRLALDSLKGRRYVSEEYVDLRACIYAEQFRLLSSLLGGSAGTACEPSGPVSPGDLKADAGAIRSFAASLAGSLSGMGKPQAFLAALLRKSESQPRLFSDLVESAACGPDRATLTGIASDLGESVESALFYGRVLAAPWVTAAVGGGVIARNDPGDRPGGCPRCGSPPGLASLSGEEGIRLLHCSLCVSAREFDRSRCAFCGERDALGIFTETPEDEMWIEVCDRCRNYLKVVDRRKAGAVLPLVHVTAGLYLDILAEKKGYRRSLPYAAVG